MKVLFDHPLPFALAHGGFQIQIEQTRAALLGLGVEVELLRWWDAEQRGDILHYFGRPTGAYVQLARQRGRKVVIAELLTGLGSRSVLERAAQRCAMRAASALLPAAFTARLGWDAYQLADAVIANTPWEAHLMRTMFDAPSDRLHLVPNGVEACFLESEPAIRGQWLVCSATITERKRVVELAEAALAARTPLRVIGKPYSDTDECAKRFGALAREHPDLLRFEGAIASRPALAQAYREARGFVLMSTMETRSLAAEEAAACQCPLLLSDLPWARSVFGEDAMYCPISGVETTAARLREFYDRAPTLPPPARPKSWTEVAQMLRVIYEAVLSKSR